MERINIIKTSGNLWSRIGIVKKTTKVVLGLSGQGIYYNSTLGNLGLIESSYIESISLREFMGTDVIEIRLKDHQRLLERLGKFGQRMSKLYREKSGADILIFPQDVDMSLDSLLDIMNESFAR